MLARLVPCSAVRVLIVDTYYAAFVAAHYAARPGLAARPYEEQLASLMAERFGTAAAYSHHLRALGHEAVEVIASCEPLQRAWAREHGRARLRAGLSRLAPGPLGGRARRTALRAVLAAQVEAWNRGDVDGFMDGYAREDATTFVSGDTLTRGWQTVLERYRRSYDSREKMGTLEFSELELKPLSPFYITATGRWQLTRADDAPRGRFTLIFRRTAAGWRIVHDHTSAGQ
jgi:ketosteroid isomerase-like protein